jgi:glucosamine--fructose-6-phosphate aminotransferase (isomerizing)
MTATPAPRPGHPYHMHDAIYAQPGALRLVMRGNEEALAGAAARLRDAEGLALAGIGSSWHACLAAELLFAGVGGRGHRAHAYPSFELARYWPAPGPGFAVIAVSHSGGHRITGEALALAAGGGVRVAVTGKGAPALAADYTLRTVDQEASSAHTVSYTCALAVLAALAAAVGGDADFAHAIEEIPDALALLLGQESWEELAARFGDRGRYWFVGGGPNTATAYEAALKMKEAAHATAEGVNCEQFLHGAWASVEAADVVFVIAPPGPARERGVAVARAAREIGAAVVVLAREDDRELGALATETIALPEIDERLSPILAVVPCQLFTYHTAVLRGVNPDTMRTDQPAHARARAAFTL